MKLIIQIPAFNEQGTIAQTLRDIPKKIDGITSIETLVVDDGSSDNTVDAARRAGATHVVELRTHRGLSAAFRAGIDASLRLGADIIVNTDADNQYAAADIATLVAPIIKGTAEVVIGDREVAKSPHMSPLKRSLQRFGSWTVGLASGVRVSDVTSGFRAFSRDAAMQINVFNPFTYTLETIIQSGARNLGVQSVPVRTNAPTRPSRLFPGLGTYLRKSVATIFRIYTLYKPLKTFFALGGILLLIGAGIGVRFIWHFAEGDRAGHIQSLILAAIFLIVGAQTMLIGLVTDLISVNRRLSEEVLIRLKRMESPVKRVERVERVERPGRRDRDRPSRPVAAAATASPVAKPAGKPPQKPSTQWVWLVDEDKLEDRGIKTEEKPAEPDDSSASAATTAAAEESASDNGPSRRRRRRRGGLRPRPELPGNRGKHLE